MKPAVDARPNPKQLGLHVAKAWKAAAQEGGRAFWRESRYRLRAKWRAAHPLREARYSVAVSVLLPASGATGGLRQMIEAILRQDFAGFELLLTYSASCPETQHLVQRYASDRRVRVFAGRETWAPLIAQARGKYVAFPTGQEAEQTCWLRQCFETLEKDHAEVLMGTRRELLMARASSLRMVGGLPREVWPREDPELHARLTARGYRTTAVPFPSQSSSKLHGAQEDAPRGTSASLPRARQLVPLLPRVAFVVPWLQISGGIAVVLQYAHRLEQLGHSVTILPASDERDCPWFPHRSFRIVPLSQSRGEMFDILLATFWTTVDQVRRLPAEKRYYFIQSDESRFYPDNEARQRAALETYQSDLEPIVIARWLQTWLQERFGRRAHYLPNGIDKTLFHPAAPLEPKGAKVRVLLEGAIDLPFKGMKNAFRAVEDLDCEIWCISSAGRPERSWRCDRFFSKVPQPEMKHIYSSCDILLKMSEVEAFFLPPLEMMACGQGACVLGEVTGIEEYVQDGVNALVVKKGDVEGARHAVQRLITDINLRQRLIAAGLETARRFDWDALTVRLQQILCS